MDAGHPTSRTSRAWLLYGAFIGLMVAGLYAPSAGAPFVSDDYDFLWLVSQQDFAEALRFDPHFYHFAPVSMGFWWLLYRLFGPAPAAFQSVGLILHALNGALVGSLAWRLSRRWPVVFGAGLLFVTAGAPYEVPLWATGIFTSLSALLYLGSLWAYVGFCDAASGAPRRPAAGRYGLFLILFALALLAHEQAITLIAACGLYSLLVVRRRPTEWMALIPPAALAAAFVLFKLLGSETALFTNQAGLKETFWAFRIALLRALIPNAGLSIAAALDDVGRPFLAARLAWWGALLAGGTLLVLRARREERFLLAWLAGHLAVMAGAAHLSSRHYYLPLAISAILISSLLYRLARRALRFTGEGAGRWAAGLLLACCVALGAVGASQIAARAGIWREAAGVAGRLVEAARREVAGCPACTTIYAVNWPDGLPTTEDDVAYIFRNGIVPALYLAGVPPTTRVVRRYTPDADWTWEFRRKGPAGAVTEEELLALAGDERALMLRYYPADRTLRRVTAP